MVENDCSATFGENTFEAVWLHETGHNEWGSAFLPNQMWQLRLISHAISSSASSEILASSGRGTRQTGSIKYFNTKIIRSWAEKSYLHPLKKYFFPVAGIKTCRLSWKEGKKASANKSIKFATHFTFKHPVPSYSISHSMQNPGFRSGCWRLLQTEEW